MKSLFDITQDFEALYDLLVERDGDISDPDVARIIDDLFAELNSDLETKVDNYAAFIKELQARSNARKEEADRMMKRARVDANLADNLEKRLKFGLEAIRRTKVETSRFTVSIQGNGGVAPMLVEHEEDIPEQYFDHPPVLNRTFLREDLEAGKSIPGCRLGERGTQLRIR